MLGELFASQRGLGFLLMTAIDLNDVKTILADRRADLGFRRRRQRRSAGHRQAPASRRGIRRGKDMNRIAVARDMGAPLHHQIYLVLADGISTGRYGVGEALPTEEQLTQACSASRASPCGAPWRACTMPA